MKILAACFVVLLWLSPASAQTPVTYKCWCTLHGGAEKEYSIPNGIFGQAHLPIELPDYGRVICSLSINQGREKTTSQEAISPNLSVDLSTAQPLETNKDGYTPISVMNGGFDLVYNKRITVLETPAYSISIELIKS